MTFAQMINKARESHGWSMHNLAKRSKVSTAYISKIENRGLIPHPRTTYKLGTTLKIDLLPLYAQALKEKTELIKSQYTEYMEREIPC